ncbi:MAG: Mur ligase family protein, partial [Candidatus Uhrbacteria bacterium]|nr:Mur ligase family protein [Candidatus Uhrbacteria bacterium]
MRYMLSRLKSLIPVPLLGAYHLVLARAAEFVYGHPSDRMVVVGITGTNGKSSTVMFTAQLLTELGAKVGYTSTAGFSIAGKAIENRMKMTMPGRFVLQRLLRRMVKSGCTHAVVETSSQGLIQHRHLGINYDLALFTNLTPEHIEAHGGFESYKAAKSIL